MTMLKAEVSKTVVKFDGESGQSPGDFQMLSKLACEAETLKKLNEDTCSSLSDAAKQAVQKWLEETPVEHARKFVVDEVTNVMTEVSKRARKQLKDKVTHCDRVADGDETGGSWKADIKDESFAKVSEKACKTIATATWARLLKKELGELVQERFLSVLHARPSYQVTVCYWAIQSRRCRTGGRSVCACVCVCVCVAALGEECIPEHCLTCVCVCVFFCAHHLWGDCLPFLHVRHKYKHPPKTCAEILHLSLSRVVLAVTGAGKSWQEAWLLRLTLLSSNLEVLCRRLAPSVPWRTSSR